MYLIPNLGILENLDPRGWLRRGVIEGGYGATGRNPSGILLPEPELYSPVVTFKKEERLAKRHLDALRLPSM